MSSVIAYWTSQIITNLQVSKPEQLNTNLSDVEIVGSSSLLFWFPHEGGSSTTNNWMARVTLSNAGQIDVVFRGPNNDIITGSVFFVNTESANLGIFRSDTVSGPNSVIPSSVSDLPNNELRVVVARPAYSVYPKLDIAFKINKSYSIFGELVIFAYTQTNTTNNSSNGTNLIFPNSKLDDKKSIVPLHISYIASINNFLNKLRDNSCPRVQMLCQTDQFGLNLGEIICIVYSDNKYPGEYPKKLVGICEGNSDFEKKGQTLFSARPELEKVLLLSGDTLYAQTTAINNKYNIDNSNCDFYGKILIYSTLKYFFAGLITTKFRLSWLLRKYNKSFLEKLGRSEFKCFLQLFIDPTYGLSDLYKYFRWEFKDCDKCCK